MACLTRRVPAAIAVRGCCKQVLQMKGNGSASCLLFVLLFPFSFLSLHVLFPLDSPCRRPAERTVVAFRAWVVPPTLRGVFSGTEGIVATPRCVVPVRSTLG